MPLFKSRTVEEILNDAINYVHYNTNLTDFNVGSVIRTILEAMALEDSDQYSQMEIILKSFFLEGASGSSLDDRAAQFDVSRKSATPATGDILFMDTELRRSFLVKDADSGDLEVFVQDVAVFPTSNFKVRLGEGTAVVEDVTVSSVSTASNSLTLSTPVVNSHVAASVAVDEIDNLANLVCFVTGEADRIIPSGITMRSKPTGSVGVVEAVTTTTGTLLNGNFASSSVPIITTTLGKQSNLSERALNEISGGTPFNGATVVNLATISGGSNVESDQDLRKRISDKISGLSSGTVRAIKSALLEVTNAATAQSVQRVKIFEDFDNDVVNAYITDGSSDFIADTSNFASDTLSEDLLEQSDQLKLNSSTGFDSATKSSRKYIVIDLTGASGKIHATTYSEIGASEAVNSVNGLLPITPENHTFSKSTSVHQAELISKSTGKARKYYFLDSFPLSEDAIYLYTTSGAASGEVYPALGASTLLVENTDYLINRATGQIEFLEGKIPDEGTALLAVYEVFTGLVKSAQTTVDGSLEQFDLFPGVRSAGVKVRVLAAKTREINVTIELTVDTELTNSETASFLVSQFATSYINTLDLGSAVIMAEIIDRAMGVNGVTNIKIVEDDIAIAHDEVAVTGTITFI